MELEHLLKVPIDVADTFDAAHAKGFSVNVMVFSSAEFPLPQWLFGILPLLGLLVSGAHPLLRTAIPGTNPADRLRGLHRQRGCLLVVQHRLAVPVLGPVVLS
jgi:hypothetical protein